MFSFILAAIGFMTLTFAKPENNGENASLDGYKEINFIDESGTRLPSVIIDAGVDANGDELKLKIRLDCSDFSPVPGEGAEDCDAHFFLKRKNENVSSSYKYIFTTRYYGSSMEPTQFSIKNNELAVSGSSHGNGRFAVVTDWVEKIQLFPLRHISSYTESFGGLGGGSESSKEEINYKSGMASNSESYSNCKPESMPDEDYYDTNRFKPVKQTSSDFIPFVELSDAAKKNWKTVKIENCSRHPKYNSTKKTPTGTYNVLAVEPSIFLIDFLKENLTVNSKPWINDDHLEIWVATKSDESHCHDNLKIGKNISKFGMNQWGIIPKSGKIINAAGSTELKPLVESTEIIKNGKTIGYRMKVEVPDFKPEKSLISFSFVEGDGKFQELFSTSQVEYGNAFSLGKLLKTSCSETAGVLNWELPEIFDGHFFKNKKLPDETEKNPIITEKMVALMNERKKLGCDDFKKNTSTIHYSQITNINGRGPDEFAEFGTNTVGSVRPKGGNYNRFQFRNVQDIECNQIPLDQDKSIPKFFTRKFDLSDIVLEPGKYRLKLGPNSNFSDQVLPALNGTVAINGTTVLKLESKSKSPFTVDVEIQKNTSLQATITYERNSTIEFDMYKLVSKSE